MLQATELTDIPHIRHGFMTRQGGVSGGGFASLNVGITSGDDLAAVRENRARVVERLTGARTAPLLTLHQVHGAEVLRVAAPWAEADRPQADGLVTDRPGMVLGALASDCMPVLLADRRRPIIGAVHAGWRGAKAGILQRAVAAMEALGSQRADMVAVIGPAIQWDSYEVDAAFHDSFRADGADNARFFKPGARPGHFLFDLTGYGLAQLQAAGIGHASRLNEDTYTQPEKFHSYRRNCHQDIAERGSGIGAICLAL